MGKKLPKSFFNRGPNEVARDLVGRELVRVIGQKEYSGLIVEVGAYSGKGPVTANQASMEETHGKIYIMPFRGQNFLNITTYEEEQSSCVWIRELYPTGTGLSQEDINGPGKLTKVLGIDRSVDGLPINSDQLWIEGNGVRSSQVNDVPDANKSKNCVGIYRLQI